MHTIDKDKEDAMNGSKYNLADQRHLQVIRTEMK